MNIQVTDQVTLYAECGSCGARMCAGTSPCSMRQFLARLKRASRCPYCDGVTYLCKTEGPDAVTEPRAPLPVDYKGGGLQL